MEPWPAGTVRPLMLKAIGQRYGRYRLPDAQAEKAMINSLQRYGQISPIVVCLREETPELIDGFKRLAAARGARPLQTLSARLLEVDERGAKAAIYGLNRVASRPCELEEAWIVHALVREDGLTQVETAELLGRHKSWVCRRLALLEKLSEPAMEDLRLGLLSATLARQVVRLPAGNQAALLETVRRESLSGSEVTGVVDLLVAAASRDKEAFILADPREALWQARAAAVPAWDPRLSPIGNRIGKQLGYLLDQLGRMETWLHHRGRAEVTAFDRGLLQSGFVRLSRDARSVADLAEDFVGELHVP